MRKRVVITGLGTVNPIGNNVADFWENMHKGLCGIGPITKFDTEDFPAKIAGELKDFDPAGFMDRKLAQRMDPFTQYAVCAAMEAIKDAGFGSTGWENPYRTGVVLGNGIGGFASMEEGYGRLFSSGPRRIPVMTIPKMISNMAAGTMGVVLDIHGPCYSVVTACASGTDAIGNAAHWIENGSADIMITGGVEAGITRLSIGGFCVLQALTVSHNHDPEKASRPFEKGRDGFVMGEGAGIVVLEEYEHAVRRGARIYCELTGYGATCDAYHMTAPHPEGIGAVQAIRNALASAGLKPEDIDYVNAHGTSTKLNDRAETIAIREVFGSHAQKLKVSSIKSMLGHCIGAAGGIEAVSSALSIYHQWLPPTINYEEPDPECDLDYIPNKGIDCKVDNIISNSFGFGGHNAVIALSRVRT